MKKTRTLTGQVFAATMVARPIYRGGDETRRTRASQAQHLSSLLASYSETIDGISEVAAHYLITGKRKVPVSLVRHYTDGTSCCPEQLYFDIKTYLDSDSISRSARRQLWDDLCQILEEVPFIDRAVMLSAAMTSCENSIYVLLTEMLYYAWRTDLAGYTYVAA